MSETLSSEIKTSLGWLNQDALDLSVISDSARLEFHATLADGIGADQADRVWHNVRTLAAGVSEDLVLSALPLAMFGDSLQIAMAKVTAILLVNAATVVGENLVVGGAPAHEWQGPFAAAGDKLVVPADSCLLLVNKKSGWLVTAGSADKLRITNDGTGDISYKLAILGTSA
jgi:hypothetical protein